MTRPLAPKRNLRHLRFAGAVLLQGLIVHVTVATAQMPKQQIPNNVAPHPAPAQPIPYSHKTHLALGLNCQNCHVNPEPGNLMTFPATSKCMQCHVDVAKDRAPIQKLAEFAKSGDPVPWVRVYQITPGVNWSHRRHLRGECSARPATVRFLNSMPCLKRPRSPQWRLASPATRRITRLPSAKRATPGRPAENRKTRVGQRSLNSMEAR